MKRSARMLVLLGLVAACGKPARPPASAPAGAEIAVSVVLPGASAEEVEQQLTERLEEAVTGVEGLQRLRSVSRPGVAELRLAFVDEATARAALPAVRDALAAIATTLPMNTDPPVVLLLLPGVQRLIVVDAPSLPASETRQLANRVVRERLLTVPGVMDVRVCGGDEPELAVTLDPARLAALDLSAAEVLAGLQRQNVQLPAGRVGGGDELQALRDLPLADRAGAVVRLGDVAIIAVGGRPAACQAASRGMPVIVLEIDARADAPIDAELARLTPDLPAGVSLRTAAAGEVTIADREPRWPVGAWPPPTPSPTATAAPELIVDRDAAAALGVPVAEITATARLIDGIRIADLADGREVIVRVPAGTPAGALQVRTAGGALLPLDRVVQLRARPAGDPHILLRENRRR